MGHPATATFLYGFILKEKGIRKLLAALGEKGFDHDSSNIAEFDWFDTIEEWVRMKRPTEPFRFSAENDPDHEEVKEAEPAFNFYGRDDIKDGHAPDYSLETWTGGYNVKYMPVPEPWKDEKFMNNAKEAFKELENTPAFKTAGITVLPQWLLKVSG